MSKLQRIKRSNGSCIFSVNIPLEAIEELNWEKGSELRLIVVKGKLIISKEKEGL